MIEIHPAANGFIIYVVEIGSSRASMMGCLPQVKNTFTAANANELGVLVTKLAKERLEAAC